MSSPEPPDIAVHEDHPLFHPIAASTAHRSA
jgi:hypothetical protein